MRQYHLPVKLRGILGRGQQFLFMAVSDGSQIGDARPHRQYLAMLGRVVLYMGKGLRARPHQAHVSPYYIPELWHLIQLPLAQIAAHRSHTLIAGRGNLRPNALCARHHGTKFPQTEDFAVFPDAFLGKEHRPARTAFHRERHHHQHRAQQEQPPAGANEIEDALAMIAVEGARWPRRGHSYLLPKLEATSDTAAITALISASHMVG